MASYYLPRWFRAIRWDRARKIIGTDIGFAIVFVLIPSYLCFFKSGNVSAKMIAFMKPKTQEEIMAIKNQYQTNTDLSRDWQFNQYRYQVPPKYDLAERRKQYPEYYGNRYDGYKRDGWAVHRYT